MVATRLDTESNPVDCRRAHGVSTHSLGMRAIQRSIHCAYLPRIGKQPFQINLLLAVRARLLLADDTPAANAELVKPERTVRSSMIGQ